MGHFLTPKGVKVDPANVKAILGMPLSQDVTIVQCLLDLVNYLSRFIQVITYLQATMLFN